MGRFFVFFKIVNILYFPGFSLENLKVLCYIITLHTTRIREHGRWCRVLRGSVNKVRRKKPKTREKVMAYLSMKQLLETGVHFGHQTKRWNPKMKRYIFGARNGIYIIDLQQTVKMFRTAYDFIKDVTKNDGEVLFVGTKRQAQNSIEQAATRCAMGYVTNRWVGGLLTNFETVKKSIDKLNKLDELKEAGDSTGRTKKELLLLEKKRLRLEKNLGGLRKMKKLPKAIFVVDSRRELIGVKEAKKLGIPVVAIVDTNCDPDDIDFIIPGNDDAIRAIELFANTVADACLEGKTALEQELIKETEQKAEAEAAVAAAAAAEEQAAQAPVENAEEASAPVVEEKTTSKSAPKEPEAAPKATTDSAVEPKAAAAKPDEKEKAPEVVS